MQKTFSRLFSTFLVLLPFSSFAHKTQLEFDQCHFESGYGFTYKDGGISIAQGHHPLFEVTSDNELLVNGKKHPASHENIELLTEYRESYQKVAEEATKIALDGAAFGTEVALDVLGNLFSDANAEFSDLEKQLTDSLNQFNQELKQLNSWDSTSIEKLIENGFERRIEESVETFAESLEQNLSSYLFSPSFWFNLSTFAAKMETFEAQIDERVAVFEKRVERQASDLCQHIEKIDVLESQFLQAYPNAKWFDVFTKHSYSENSPKER
ncbi:MAG: DUF2884 family protein [Pseudomonadota bacterium]